MVMSFFIISPVVNDQTLNFLARLEYIAKNTMPRIKKASAWPPKMMYASFNHNHPFFVKVKRVAYMLNLESCDYTPPD